MESLVNKLSNRNQLVLLSDHGKEWIDFIRNVHPFLSHFSYQFYSFELGHIKQERITYSLVMDRICKNPRECVFVDDLEGNIITANSVGLNSILFEDSCKLVNDLRSLGLL